MTATVKANNAYIKLLGMHQEDVKNNEVKINTTEIEIPGLDEISLAESDGDMIHASDLDSSYYETDSGKGKHKKEKKRPVETVNNTANPKNAPKKENTALSLIERMGLNLRKNATIRKPKLMKSLSVSGHLKKPNLARNTTEKPKHKKFSMRKLMNPGDGISEESSDSGSSLRDSDDRSSKSDASYEKKKLRREKSSRKNSRKVSRKGSRQFSFGGNKMMQNLGIGLKARVKSQIRK